MAIAAVVESMYENTKDAYDALSDLGATIPSNKNLSNLIATINTLPGA